MNDDASSLTDEQASMLGGFCCCLLLIAAIAIVVLVVVTRRKTTGANQPPAPPPSPGGSMHLSVLALALDASVRAWLEAQLAAPLAVADAVAQRVALVQRTCTALLTVASAWRFFGYGEKDLGDLVSAEQSYRLALEDFRRRSALPGEPGGTLFVVTLVLATRAHLPGVARLDDAQEVRQLLTSRAGLQPAVLLGAEQLIAPQQGGMTDATVALQFPEMQRLPAVSPGAL